MGGGSANRVGVVRKIGRGSWGNVQPIRSREGRGNVGSVFAKTRTLVYAKTSTGWGYLPTKSGGGFHEGDVVKFDVIDGFAANLQLKGPGLGSGGFRNQRVLPRY